MEGIIHPVVVTSTLTYGSLDIFMECIIRQVVVTSALSWFIRYIYVCNLQFLNYVIFKSPSDIGDLNRLWTILFMPFDLLAPKDF